MSYILDALKKADAERERGSVPGLHSHPLGQVDDDDDDESGKRPALPPVAWLGAGVGLCLIAVLSWQLLVVKKDEPVAAGAVAAAGGPASEQVAETGQMPAQMPSYAPPPMSPPPLQQQTSPPPQPAPRMGQQGMPPATQQRPPAARERPPAANATTSANAPPANNQPGSTRASAGERVPMASELPDDVRQSLPQLVIGGAMYSDTPASRMLIVNSQVFHEGDQPYQGLVLEEIKLKSAVFRYRGHRYAINY